MKEFFEWLKPKETRKFINFRSFFTETDETNKINESVINKIKKLYTYASPERIVSEFKSIFEIKGDIKISKVDIGGSFNPETLEITYSSMNSLIHELVHYLQIFKNHTGEYITATEDDCGILKYLTQPLELNNWAISLAADAEDYKSFVDFLNAAEKSDNFWNAKRKERLNHILYLLTNNVGCSVRKKYKEKVLNKAKQYYLVVKALKKDISEHYVKSFDEPWIL